MTDGQDPADASSNSGVPSIPVTPTVTPVPPAPQTSAGPWVRPTRRLLWWEIIAVFAVSLRISGGLGWTHPDIARFLTGVGLESVTVTASSIGSGDRS